MRICHIVSSFRPDIGGTQRATETLVAGLRARGVDAIVVTRRYSPDHPRFERMGDIPVYRLGLPGTGKVRALTFAADAFVALAWRLRRYRTLHVQNIDAPLLIGMAAKVLLRRRLVATIHGEMPIIDRSQSRLGRARLRPMARLVDAFTSINPANTQSLVHIGVPRDRIHEIPNGIDTEHFRPPSERERTEARSALGVPEGAFVSLYMGRLETYKRVDMLIDSWSRLDETRRGELLIVGVGSQAAALRSQAEGLGVDVRFEGPTDEPIKYLHAADAFVNASGDSRQQWYEGLSVALLEAMSVGLLAIVTRGPGNDVLVTDGLTGLSVPIEDGEALRACLERAIADPELCTRIGRQGHTRVYETYAADVVAQQVQRVYQDVRS